jgi:RecA-family ATPase
VDDCLDGFEVTDPIKHTTGLREPPGERCRVWYHCGDDNMEELHRRVAAICQRYNLGMAELEGWLFLTTPREFELRVAEGYMEVKTDDATINRIHDQIEANAVDVAILDPLVKLHSVREADVGMDRVIGVFQAVADEQGCSVEIVHHTRKGAAGRGRAPRGCRHADALRRAGPVLPQSSSGARRCRLAAAIGRFRPSDPASGRTFRRSVR